MDELTIHDKVRRLERLNALADRLAGQAEQVRNGDTSGGSERLALDFLRDAVAIRWAIEPWAESVGDEIGALEALREAHES